MLHHTLHATPGDSVSMSNTLSIIYSNHICTSHTSQVFDLKKTRLDNLFYLSYSGYCYVSVPITLLSHGGYGSSGCTAVVHLVLSCLCLERGDPGCLQ